MIKEPLPIFDGAEHYQKFLESLSQTKKINCDLTSTILSKNLYYDLWKIQEAAWKYMVNNHRSDRHPISEIAQDLIAFYLRAALPDEYSVQLEVQGRYKLNEKEKSLFVDIVIYKNELPHFMIEVKTNLGYQRSTIEQINKQTSHVEARRIEVAQAFGVNKSKIIYVLLSDGNVSKDFRNRYWNQKERKSNEITSDFRLNVPYNFIFPLFHNCDPYYYKYDEKIDKKKTVRNSHDDEILGFAEANIVTPLEHIIKLILSDADKKPCC